MEVGFAAQRAPSLEEDPWEDESPENSTMLLSRSFEEKNELAHLMPTFVRGETPDTIITDRVWYPDLCLYCSSCEEYVFIEDLPDHRMMHRYMAELDIEVTPEIPTNDELISARHEAVRRLKNKGRAKVDSETEARADESNSVDHANRGLFPQVHHLNGAYDFLVKYFHSLPCHHYGPPYGRSEVDTDDVFSKGLRCSLASGLGVGAASFQNEKFREKMEDTMVYQDCFGQDPRKCYLAVFNGYHGNYAAQLAADELHHSLLCEMLRFDPFTTCSCAYNMVEGHGIADLEIHRPRTRFSERVGLHTTSTNIIEQIIHTCEERLDAMAAAAAERQTPQSKEDQAPTETTDLFELKMASAFTKSFFYTDWLLKRGQDAYSTVRWSGCGATCLLLRETEPSIDQPSKPFSASPKEIARLYLANVGACHAILIRNNRNYRLTQNHVPSRKRERKRILEEGGKVSSSKREPLVNGVLPYTRGLGSHGDMALKRCVIATPYNSAVRIDDRCQAIILATPGFWHALSESEAMGLLVAELPCNRIEAPSRMSVDSLLGRRKSATTRATTAATSRPTPFTDETEGRDGDTPFMPPDIADDLSSGRMADVDTERLEDSPSVCVDEHLTPDVGEASNIANSISRKLVQASILAGSTENISVQVVLFPAAFSTRWKLKSHSRPSERRS